VDLSSSAWRLARIKVVPAEAGASVVWKVVPGNSVTARLKKLFTTLIAATWRLSFGVVGASVFGASVLSGADVVDWHETA